nr:hypothetical protein CFP56_19530 [Quercus suber]
MADCASSGNAQFGPLLDAATALSRPRRQLRRRHARQYHDIHVGGEWRPSRDRGLDPRQRDHFPQSQHAHDGQQRLHKRSARVGAQQRRLRHRQPRPALHQRLPARPTQRRLWLHPRHARRRAEDGARGYGRKSGHRCVPQALRREIVGCHPPEDSGAERENERGAMKALSAYMSEGGGAWRWRGLPSLWDSGPPRPPGAASTTSAKRMEKQTLPPPPWSSPLVTASRPPSRPKAKCPLLGMPGRKIRPCVSCSSGVRAKAGGGSVGPEWESSSRSTRTSL